MTYEYIVVSRQDGWATITLNRPEKMNALRPAMLEEIGQAADKLAAESSIRCIVIRANGNHFSAGYDVTTKLDTSDTKEMWLANRRNQDVFTRLNSLPVVTICEMKGYVVGAGLLLAAACNLRYAAPDSILFIPELDMGIPFSLGGVAMLARHIGITRTSDLVLNCSKIRADDVGVSNFITEVVEIEKLEQRVSDIASKLAKRPNSLILSSVSTIREAERSLMPNPASDLFTMLYVDREQEAKSVRVEYSKKFEPTTAN